jgi:hypothetical protein
VTVESAKTDAEPPWLVELRYRAVLDVLADAVAAHQGGAAAAR